MNLSPTSGSVLTAQSLEPYSDSVFPSLSALLPLMFCLYLLNINKNFFKNFIVFKIFKFSFYFFKFTHLFLRQWVSTSEWGRGREEERYSSRLPAQGTISQICDIMTWAKVKSWTLDRLSHLGASRFFKLSLHPLWGLNLQAWDQESHALLSQPGAPKTSIHWVYCWYVTSQEQ